ncbi:MAG: T9SS C-terminal target domain-containing protein [Ignavibacteriae bacterium]|nr:MAG: T9SS C-terminal target domain-containing protein [Ignavibacteriota bacterium]
MIYVHVYIDFIFHNLAIKVMRTIFSLKIKLLGNELTHLHAITMTNHTVTKSFNYTATASPGIDTIFAAVTTGTSAWNWAPSKRIVIRDITGIPQGMSVVTKYKLAQNYPNPFNPSINISFELPKNTELKLKIFDIIGNGISTVIDSRLEKGTYNIKWDGSNYASGVYFYKLIIADFEMTKKMILTK